jgi:hypothetical protein
MSVYGVYLVFISSYELLAIGRSTLSAGHFFRAPGGLSAYWFIGLPLGQSLDHSWDQCVYR